MKKFFIILLAGAVIGALILGGCKTPSTTTTTKQTQTSISTTTTTPHKVLKIGSVQNLTITMGVEQKKWLDLLAKLTNEQGGWKIGNETYDIDMIVYDGQGDPAKAKSYLEKLVLQDGVKFVFGSATDNPATDAEVTDPNKIVCLGLDVIGTSADPKIQYYWTPNGLFFGRGYTYVLYHEMEVKGKKSYVSLSMDNMMGHVTAGWSNETWAVAAPDVKNLGTVYYDPSTSDFGPLATKIMSLHPDVVDAAWAGIPQIYKSLYDSGYQGTFIPGALSPNDWQSVITQCGKAYVEGWKYGLQDPRLYPNQDPAMLALVDAYTEEYGTWISDGCMWVSYWFVLKDALDNTQSVNPEIIKAYLDNQPHPVKVMTGYCQLFARPDANNLRTVSGGPGNIIGIVKDGELVPFQEVSVKDQYLASILSYGLVDVYKPYWDQYGYPTFPPQGSVIKFSDLGIIGHD